MELSSDDGPVVQRIERQFAELVIQVRFLTGLPEERSGELVSPILSSFGEARGREPDRFVMFPLNKSRKAGCSEMLKHLHEPFAKQRSECFLTGLLEKKYIHKKEKIIFFIFYKNDSVGIKRT